MLNSEIKKEVLKDIEVGDVIYLTRRFINDESDKYSYSDHLCIVPRRISEDKKLRGIFFSKNCPKGDIRDLNIDDSFKIKIIRFENITKLRRENKIGKSQYNNIVNIFSKEDDTENIVKLLDKICKNYEI